MLGGKHVWWSTCRGASGLHPGLAAAFVDELLDALPVPAITPRIGHKGYRCLGPSRRLARWFGQPFLLKPAPCGEGCAGLRTQSGSMPSFSRKTVPSPPAYCIQAPLG